VVKTDSGDFNLFIGMVSFLFVPYTFWFPILVNGLTYDLLFSLGFACLWISLVIHVNKETKIKGLKSMLSDSLETLTKTENNLEMETGTYNSLEVEKIMNLKRKELNIKLVLQMNEKK
jgi:hypothetical protein